MLGECPEAMSATETGAHSYFAYVTVDDVDELYAEMMNKRTPDRGSLRYALGDAGIWDPHARWPPSHVWAGN
jgi:hypothetical protein